ncbi:hypothetical protein BEWA_030320 [Theileria equi strain WA]|uniref:Uncharacterized protein n=1 Tax=Theileria equi strain WA TaxID=1537102 RepID=L0AZ51_THEEQ|nr:hypothetical protein BEWA_030320 [Theileria equi strain WA]AFZ80179.1 hypothetical protein BEWA_030320 [Theileria equi strain WA]|eukprot:XP_004829845.1 hypothetical protein BEWA_030320 [Theileria equi strain WA]
MEGYVSGLAADLLERTHRYLAAANLGSFILPLPFSDENVLDTKGLIVKVLSNVSSVTKDKLQSIVVELSGRRKKDHSSFSKAYDSTFERVSKRDVRRTSAAIGNLKANLRNFGRTGTGSGMANGNSMNELQGIHSAEEVAGKLIETIQGLTDATIVGFILIIGAKKQNAGDTDVPLIPMAGGIVELLDPEEHCIRAVWCDPSLPSHVEADFVKILILRIIGHAFDYGYPGSSTPQKFKHVSISNTLGIMFPKSCYSFLINGLKFGKHFETGASGGSHEDSVSNPCRCFKLANLCDSQLFWGISESRLRNTFNNVKSQVPTMPSQETLKAIQCLSA